MSKDNIVSLSAPAAGVAADPLTDLLRRNARRLVEVAVAAEFEVYLSAFSEEWLPDGRRRVVRNGYLPAREILTGIGGGGSFGAEGARKFGQAGAVSFLVGAAVCASLRESGRSDSVAVFVGDFDWGHAQGRGDISTSPHRR